MIFSKKLTFKNFVKKIKLKRIKRIKYIRSELSIITSNVDIIKKIWGENVFDNISYSDYYRSCDIDKLNCIMLRSMNDTFNERY